MAASARHGRKAVLVAPIALLVFTRAVMADDGDDFSNNLFSDLAPILALFGEQVTKQFMSQSLGWADNIIFAMAPIGIITAIIGAIRVAGPVWLKAIIGRARETRAMAEMELLSSTSTEVCEVWNGQAVVRMMGSPRILELIVFQDNKDSCEIFTLDSLNASGNSCLEKNGEINGDSESLGTEHYTFMECLAHALNSALTDVKKSTEWSETGNAPRNSLNIEHKDAANSMLKDAPNISFNIRPPESRRELRLAAIVGIILQLGVLIFSGCVTYFPTLSYKKNNHAIAGYAYPFMFVGTLVLVTGMLICAFIIEQCTKEMIWMREGGKRSFQVAWVQQGGQEVNDQMLDSYALFVRGDCRSLMTSRRGLRLTSISYEGVASLKYILVNVFSQGLLAFVKLLGYQYIKGGEQSSIMILLFKILTVFGSAISLIGFLIQFIGLRGMHWSASVAQLAISLIMAMLRAWVRRNLAHPPLDQKLVIGHELDWLSVRLTENPVKLWQDQESAPEQESAEFYNRKFWSANYSFWDMQACSSMDSYEMYLEESEELLETPKDMKLNEDESMNADGNTSSESAQRESANGAVKLRQQLGALTHWPGKSSTLAVGTAKAIESVMANLIDPSRFTNKTSFAWSMPAAFCDQKEAIFFRAFCQSGQWKVDATQIEAVLSLWLYSFQQEKIDEADKTKWVKESRLETKGESMDWLRHGSTAMRKDRIRLLGPLVTSTCRDLRWYLGTKTRILTAVTLEILTAISMESNDAGDEPDTITVVRGKDILGFGDGHKEFLLKQAYRVKQRELRTDDFMYAPSNTTGAGPSEELVKRFEQDWYLPALVPEASEGDSEESLHLSVLFESDAKTDRTVHTTLSSENVLPSPGNPSGRASSEEPLQEPWSSEPGSSEPGSSEPLGTEYLAVLVETPLEQLLAQSIFSAFVCAVSKQMPPIDGDIQDSPLGTTVEGEEADWQNVKLHHAHIAKVVEEFERGGLGSWEEAIVSLITPLSWHKKLPSPLPLVEYIVNIAMPSEAAGQWEAASHMYLWLFNVGRTFPGSSAMAIQTTAILREFVSVVRSLESNAKAQKRGKDEEKMFGELADASLQALAAADDETLSGLQAMYSFQRRNACGYKGPEIDQKTGLEKFGFMVGHVAPLYFAGADITRPDVLGWTPVHYLAVGADWQADRFLQRAGTKGTAQKTLTGWTPLHLAAAMGLLEVGWALLRAQSDLDVRARDGTRPLHMAVRARQRAMVAWLLDAGASVDATDESRQTALHWAALAGGTATLIDQLLSDINDTAGARDRKGRTPLLLAAKEGRTHSLLRLLSGADSAAINHQDRKRLTAVSWAARHGHTDCVSVLLQHGAVPTISDLPLSSRPGSPGRAGRTALHYAARGNYRDIATLLLEHGADANAATTEQGNTPLHMAARGNSYNTAKLLLEYNADINVANEDGITPLYYAAEGNCHDTARLLLEHGADTTIADGDGETPLHYAAMRDYHHIANLLLEHGADIVIAERYGWTPLHYAAQGNSHNTARLLLEHGVDFTIADRYGKTPLHIAAYNNSYNTTNLLLQYNADINASDNHRETPLHAAAYKNSYNTANLLLQYNADINAADENRNTSLHIAVRENNHNIAKLLLKHGADINAANQNRNTPLHIAVQENSHNIADLLLQYNADINATNENRNTPLHIAAYKNSYTTAKLLLKYGADITIANQTGDTPLHTATYSGSKKFVECLFYHDKDINYTLNKANKTLLHSAAAGNQPTLLEWLLKLKFPINKVDAYGQSPLHYTTGMGSLKSTRLLLHHGALVAARDAHGCMPLHFAAWSALSMQQSITYIPMIGLKVREQFATIFPNLDESKKSNLQQLWALQLSTLPNLGRITYFDHEYSWDKEDDDSAAITILLFKKLGDIKPADNNGLTPLHWLARAGNNLDVLTVLLRHGASPSQVDIDGLTALHWWSRASRDDSIGQKLLQSVVNLSQGDGTGKTPLHWAVAEGMPEAVGLLLDNGADLAMKDNNGKTPFDLLKIREQFDETVKSIYDHFPIDRFPAEWLYLREIDEQWIEEDLRVCTCIRELIEGSRPAV